MNLYNNLLLLILFLVVGYYSLKYLFFIIVGIIIGIYISRFYYNYSQ